MLKIIHKDTTVTDVMNDGEMMLDMENRRIEVEQDLGKPACKRFAQRGNNVHCWIEVNDVQLCTLKSAQAAFFVRPKMKAEGLTG